MFYDKSMLTEILSSNILCIDFNLVQYRCSVRSEKPFSIKSHRLNNLYKTDLFICIYKTHCFTIII